MREGENVATFAADLKHLTTTCDLTTLLIEALRDLFVCDLCNKEIQEKLLTQKHTFEGALQIALGAEAAEKDVSAYSQDAAALANKLDSGNRRTFLPHKPHKPPCKGQGKKPSSRHNNTGTSECLSCGRSGHPRLQCRYRSYTCHSCGMGIWGISQMLAKANLRRFTRWNCQIIHSLNPFGFVDPFQRRDTSRVKWKFPSYGIRGWCRSFTHLTGDKQQVFQRHSAPTLCYSSTHLHRAPSPRLWSIPCSTQIPRSECKRAISGS